MSRLEKLYNSEYICNLTYCIKIIFEELGTDKANEFLLADEKTNERPSYMNQLTK